MKRIPEEASADHPNIKNSLSKIEVLREWATAAGNEAYLHFADELEASLPR